MKTFALSLAAMAMLLAPGLVVATPASAARSDLQKNLCDGLNLDLTDRNTSCNNGTGPGDFNDLLHKVVNIFSAIVGVIAVIMIIVGGLRYITSGGDSGKVGTAKNTLIYAIIGLIIVALAQVIVQFVFRQATGGV